MQEINIGDIKELDGVMDGIVNEAVDALKNMNWGPLFAEYTIDLEELHRNYFDSEASPIDVAWAPLSARTIKAKGHAEKLVDTGEMQASLIANAEHAVRELNVSSTEVHLKFGTDVSYAGYHITGTNKMPQREQVGVSEEVVDVWQAEIMDNVILAMQETR